MSDRYLDGQLWEDPFGFGFEPISARELTALIEGKERELRAKERELTRLATVKIKAGPRSRRSPLAEETQ